MTAENQHPTEQQLGEGFAYYAFVRGLCAKYNCDESLLWVDTFHIPYRSPFYFYLRWNRLRGYKR